MYGVDWKNKQLDQLWIALDPYAETKLFESGGAAFCITMRTVRMVVEQHAQRMPKLRDLIPKIEADVVAVEESGGSTWVRTSDILSHIDELAKELTSEK
jgi:hypothetical protein